MTDVYRCPTHGAYAARECPECGADGDTVLGSDRRETLSRYLSYALRHEPGDAGITVDGAGWADYDAVVEAARGEYGWPDSEAVDAVVAVDGKGRFERDGDRIRAAYGHSVSVDLEPNDHPVPDVLYHGTTPEDAKAIISEGIWAGSREKVHLTDDREEAREVGARHGDDPVVLVVNARRLMDDGQRITKRGENVYTTDTVPPAFVA